MEFIRCGGILEVINFALLGLRFNILLFSSIQWGPLLVFFYSFKQNKEMGFKKIGISISAYQRHENSMTD